MNTKIFGKIDFYQNLLIYYYFAYYKIDKKTY